MVGDCSDEFMRRIIGSYVNFNFLLVNQSIEKKNVDFWTLLAEYKTKIGKIIVNVNFYIAGLFSNQNYAFINTFSIFLSHIPSIHLRSLCHYKEQKSKWKAAHIKLHNDEDSSLHSSNGNVIQRRRFFCARFSDWDKRDK